MKEIPDFVGLPVAVARVLEPIKINVEIITGRRGTKIAPLGPTSTTNDVINKLNEVLAMLQT